MGIKALTKTIKATCLAITLCPFAAAQWSEPVPVPGINTLATDYYPSISSDGTKMYFTSTRSNNEDIYLSTKVDGNWSTPINLGLPINSNARDLCPSISSDGRTLYFVSYNRPGGVGSYDIWFSNWDDSCQCWQTPISAGLNINTAYMEWSPSISHDGSKLYFSSSDPTRPGNLGGMDLCVSEYNSEGWQPAQLIQSLNSDGDEIDASIGFDDTTLYFASTFHHDLPCWHGPAVDLFVAYFSNGQWGNLQNLCDPINTQYWETGSNISSGGDTLYFARRRIPDYDEFDDIYYSVKMPDAIEEKAPNPREKTIKIDLYPNPFNDGIKILVESSDDNQLTLSIYNIVGQSIMRKEINVINGLYSFSWDGVNANNMSIPSGVYFISIQSNEIRVADRILKLK